MPSYLLLIFIFLLAAPASAQQCVVSAEPVATIDFGSVGNPFSLDGKTGAGYSLTTTVCTNDDATIAIRPKAFLCNPDWLVVPGDRTKGDDNGNFLMVNAREGNSDVFRDTVQSLCPGSRFTAEMWVINLMRFFACNNSSANPNLVFTITDMGGNKLAEQASGPVARDESVKWVPVRASFVCPGDGAVIVRITSTDGKSCGYDFGIDDIGFFPCRPPVPITLQGIANGQIAVCEEKQSAYLFQVPVSSFNNPAIQWQVNANDRGWQDIPGATAPAYQRQPTGWGIYQYRLTVIENNNKACRFTSEPMRINIYPQPFAQGTNYVFGCYGSPFKFQGAGGAQYLWSGPNGFQSTAQAPVIPSLAFGDAGTYMVKVTTEVGCVGYDTTELVVSEAPVGSINIEDTGICIGDGVQLQAGGAQHYVWFPSAGLSSDTIQNPIARPDKTMEYTVYISKEKTCYDTAKVTVRVLERPAAFAGGDKFAFKARPVQMEGSVTGDAAVTFRWTPAQPLNNPRTLRPQARLTQTTTFRLEAIAGNGCGTAYDEVKIEVIDGLFIPTAFSPNGDYLNDKWEIIGIEEYPKATVKVFDRWDTKMYQSTGSSYTPWNGKYKGMEATPGVYLYLLDLGNGSPLRKGTITVIK